jgi:hypothetical protein
VGATLAEPAIGSLRITGSAVRAWEAPLLYMVLNTHTGWLIIAVGLGVGLSVCLGVARFYRNWSLKPLIFILVGLLLAVSLAAWFDPRVLAITGLAWDCGGITTGPVTVPLVLALGLGISRTIGKNDSALSGFGVVTLASAVPILTVLILGFILAPGCPQPMSEVDFASGQRAAAQSLFADEDHYRAYVIARANPEARRALFDGDLAALVGHYRVLDQDAARRHGQFDGDPDGFRRWLILNGSPGEQLAFFGSGAAFDDARGRLLGSSPRIDLGGSLRTVALNSIQAVVPLCLFLLFTLLVLMRERLKRPDEVVFGIAIALVGMFFLNCGIEFGLSRLGNSVGTALPAAVKAVDLPDEARVIPHFTPDLVYRSIGPDGQVREFFYLHQNGRTAEMDYRPEHYHAENQSYDLLPQRGPLLGPRTEGWGLIVLLLFAFVMGFGATMAEPALITMGRTVEVITVGIFRRQQLMQAVAAGVGIGIAWGVLKIVLDLPLVWLLLPAYIVLLVLTAVSDESYVSIAWDSAGVTTGPVTVPLVLAMGIGLGSQLGVVEGFGILALASAWPILVVLTMGLVLRHRQRQDIRAVESGQEA